MPAFEVRHLPRGIAGRMWLFAWTMTLITSLVGLVVYYSAIGLQLADVKREMPPTVRAEIENLADTVAGWVGM